MIFDYSFRVSIFSEGMGAIAVNRANIHRENVQPCTIGCYSNPGTHIGRGLHLFAELEIIEFAEFADEPNGH